MSADDHTIPKVAAAAPRLIVRIHTPGALHMRTLQLATPQPWSIDGKGGSAVDLFLHDESHAGSVRAPAAHDHGGDEPHGTSSIDRARTDTSTDATASPSAGDDPTHD